MARRGCKALYGGLVILPARSRLQPLLAGSYGAIGPAMASMAPMAPVGHNWGHG